jgi:branched-chain amino acid aminotransferase
LLIFAKATPASQSEPSTQRLRLVLSPFRLESRRALSGVKSTSYLDYQLAWQRATRSGFDDAVLCNGNGALCECTRANIFWVRDGRLHTPSLDSGCLPGIARELVLHWATEDGVAIKEGIFSPHELAGADEAFLTSATQGPRAVAWHAINEQDDSPHEFAAPGSLTVRLQQRWQIAVQGEHKGQPGQLTGTH